MKKVFLIALSIILFIAVIIYLFIKINDQRSAKNLYKERAYLLKEFKDKSVIRRDEIFYQMSYYRGQSVNTFYFEKKDGVLILTNDTLQYPINDIETFSSTQTKDSSSYPKILIDEVSRLLKVMDDLKIRHVSAEDRFAGIDMKIYFGEYRALLYVSNIAAIKNERWRNYVTSGQKLDENWYLVKDE